MTEIASQLKKPFLYAIALQMAVLAGLGSFNMYVLTTGRTAVLKTIPVDPWDAFRGDYLALSYDISTIKTPIQFKPGEQLFVVLSKGNPYCSVSSVSRERPPLSSHQLVLKGRVAYVYNNEVHMHYGLERYYIPEGKGSLPNRTKPDVEVAIDQFGHSAIKQIRMNGKPLIL